MRIISFAWTVAPLLAGRKTKTRRDWDYFRAKSFSIGERVLAYDEAPRFGGEQIAIIEITKKPVQQYTERMTEEDYEAEGFKYMEEQGLLVQGKPPRVFFEDWRDASEKVWVIEFRVTQTIMGVML